MSYPGASGGQANPAQGHPASNFAPFLQLWQTVVAA
jgi:hypothetical protein